MTLGILIAQFDFEFIDWVMPDGTVSDRPAREDERFNGALAMPPDRDMRVRWRRRY